MRILLSSYLFSPSVGGIETVSQLLAAQFCEEGHHVRVITQSQSIEADMFPYEVIREPCFSTLLKLVNWCDVYLHNNISLASAWPLLLMRRPWVIAHQTWIMRLDSSFGWQDHLKRFVLRFGKNIAISRSVAETLQVEASVINNPYQDNLFQITPSVLRERDLAFLGRLVSDKGVDVLLKALAILRDTKNLTPRLTIIGEGPEGGKLRDEVNSRKLGGQIVFAGVKQGEELVKLLNQHRILVLPSRWKEPFGVVALEGIACGCVALGSSGGGLPEAIGPCGMIFENGNPSSLSEKLSYLMSRPDELVRFQVAAPAHLARHSRAAIGNAYLDILRSAVIERSCCIRGLPVES